MSELEPIAEPLRGPLQRFAERVKQLGGENALAWVLFGPVVAGTFDRTKQAARNLLVLRTLDLEFLRTLAGEGNKHRDARLAVPLVMTPQHLLASQDTFPLELIEIQQKYHTVFGEDYVAGLKFEDQHVRLQCERELKVLSIGLRQGLLASGGDDKYLQWFQRDWTDGFLRTLRGMLWLKGNKSGLPPDRVLAQMERTIDRPLEGVRAAMAAEGSPRWETFRSLYADFEALENAVNAW